MRQGGSMNKRPSLAESMRAVADVPQSLNRAGTKAGGGSRRRQRRAFMPPPASARRKHRQPEREGAQATQSAGGRSRRDRDAFDRGDQRPVPEIWQGADRLIAGLPDCRIAGLPSNVSGTGADLSASPSRFPLRAEFHQPALSVFGHRVIAAEIVVNSRCKSFTAQSDQLSSS